MDKTILCQYCVLAIECRRSTPYLTYLKACEWFLLSPKAREEQSCITCHYDADIGVQFGRTSSRKCLHVGCKGRLDRGIACFSWRPRVGE
jgi:hypothetical protein